MLLGLKTEKFRKDKQRKGESYLVPFRHKPNEWPPTDAEKGGKISKIIFRLTNLNIIIETAMVTR